MTADAGPRSLIQCSLRHTIAWVGAFACIGLALLTLILAFGGWQATPRATQVFVQITTSGLMIGAPMAALKYRVLCSLNTLSSGTFYCFVLSGLASSFGAFASFLAGRAFAPSLDPTLAAHVLDALAFLPWCSAVWFVPLLPLNILARAKPAVQADGHAPGQ